MGIEWAEEFQDRLEKLEATAKDHAKRIGAGKDRGNKQETRLDLLESRLANVEYEVIALRRYAAEVRIDHLMDWGQRVLYTYLQNPANQPVSAVIWQCIQNLRESAAAFKQIVRASDVPESDCDQYLAACRAFCAQRQVDLQL